ncbi:MAG: Rieske (2Fe-2S) protein [Ignavibacteriales bacterium]|nr:Rieske (2Fe-2S) protein [Ignavibacteriales bacterium]
MTEHKVATLSSLRENKGMRVLSGGEEIALFKINDHVYAISNFCPHQHIPKLHDAVSDGTVITCPMHGWSFDLSTGNAVAGSGKLRMFPVRVSNGDVFVDLNDDAL